MAETREVVADSRQDRMAPLAGARPALGTSVSSSMNGVSCSKFQT